MYTSGLTSKTHRTNGNYSGLVTYSFSNSFSTQQRNNNTLVFGSPFWHRNCRTFRIDTMTHELTDRILSVCHFDKAISRIDRNVSSGKEEGDDVGYPFLYRLFFDILSFSGIYNGRTSTKNQVYLIKVAIR